MARKYLCGDLNGIQQKNAKVPGGDSIAISNCSVLTPAGCCPRCRPLNESKTTQPFVACLVFHPFTASTLFAKFARLAAATSALFSESNLGLHQWVIVSTEAPEAERWELGEVNKSSGFKNTVIYSRKGLALMSPEEKKILIEIQEV